MIGLHRPNLLNRYLIIAKNLNLLPQLAKVLDEVVGEGVVIVYYQ